MGEIREYEEMQLLLQVHKNYIKNNEWPNKESILRTIDWFAKMETRRVETGQLYFIF